MRTLPLWSIAEIRPSNVDKKSKPGENPVRLVNYTDVYYNQLIHSQLDLMQATATDDQIKRFAVAQDDVIITKDSESAEDIGVPAIVSNTTAEMVCGYHLTILRPDRTRVYPRFLYWYLESTEAKNYWATRANGVTRCSILTGTISQLQIPDFDPRHQKAIADYLDSETGKIDEMVAKLSLLEKRLAERSKAAVEEGVWREKGFVKLKWFMRERDVRRMHVVDKDLELLSVSIHFGVIPRSESTGNQKASADLSNYKVVRKGQIVLNRMRAFQGASGIAPIDGIVSPDYAVLSVYEGVDPAWVDLAMRTGAFTDQIALRLRGIGTQSGTSVRTPRINVSDLFELEIPLPSLDGQRRKAGQLIEDASRLRLMQAKVTQLRDLLKERRAALITDVVTGKKDLS